MHVDVIRGREALNAVRQNWNAVYAADPEAHIFLGWDWTSDWFGRWDFNWFVLAAKPAPDAKDYVAFLPLQVTTEPNRDGTFRNEIKFGSWDLADAAGLICHPDHEDEAIPALAKTLRSLTWSVLLLKHFSASTKRLRRFAKAFPEQKFDTIEREATQNGGKTICNIFPYTDLPDTWDAFLSDCLGTNARQKAKRFLKRIDQSGEFQVTHSDASTFRRDLEKMLQLWKDKWLTGQSNWLVGQILENNRVMLRGAFAAGNLLMPVLWQGDRPLCILAILIDAPRKALRFYIGGRDEEYDGPPPGFLLHAYSIRRAIGEGYRVYDFLQGNEPYKYMFGAKDRYVKTLVITKLTPETKLDPRCLPFVIEEAQKLRKKGKVEQAERVYRQIVASDPSHGPSVLTLARLRMLASDVAEAESLLKNFVALTPGSVPAWLQLGKIQQGLGNTKGAAACYRKVLALDPTNAEAMRLNREVSPLDDLLNAALGDGGPRGPSNPIISRS